MFCFDINRIIYPKTQNDECSILSEIPTDVREARVWLSSEEVDILYNDTINFINRVINGNDSFEETF